jgi:2-methylcitrate dehydratase PrpD
LPLIIALGHEAIRRGHRGIEAPVSTMGGMAAAAPLARLDETGMRHAISHGARQVSGLWIWVEDADHVDKAFDIGGMGASNGVVAVVVVQSCFTGVHDVLGDATTRVAGLMLVSDRPQSVLLLQSKYDSVPWNHENRRCGGKHDVVVFLFHGD